MPKFSQFSIDNYKEIDPRLQALMDQVIKDFDCRIFSGHRGRTKQDRLFMEGKSKLKYPHSKHNSFPSLAVDVAPYPINWSDRDRAHYFGGYVKGIASMMNIPLIWGGDWNNNTNLSDESFDDFWHFEIDEPL